MSSQHPVYLVKGDDPSLVIEATSRLLAELVGEGDPGLVVQEVADDASIGAMVDACQTPGLFVDRRVVVVRNAGRLRADEVEPLVSYLTEPMPSSSLVLVGGGGALPSRLMKAIKAHGHVVDATAPTGRARHVWISERLNASPVKLNRAAVELVNDRLGSELGDLPGVLDALAAAYGEGSSLDAEQVEPYLSPAGVAAPWELTDAIDAGDTASALTYLRRMLASGQRHPLTVMATLQRHFGMLLRLDGSGVVSEADAASLLGVAPFPAKKALAQSRRLGSMGVSRAVALLSEADVHLRGGSAWPDETILEVLVARLTKIRPRSPSSVHKPRGQRTA